MLEHGKPFGQLSLRCAFKKCGCGWGRGGFADFLIKHTEWAHMQLKPFLDRTIQYHLISLLSSSSHSVSSWNCMHNLVFIDLLLFIFTAKKYRNFSLNLPAAVLNPSQSLKNSTLSHPVTGVLQCCYNMAAVIENHKRPVRDDRVITVDLNCGRASSLSEP